MNKKIASWNVNSIKARLPVVLQWLDHVKPDILFMQELKGTDENFPVAEFESRGYTVSVNGQKTYNGVAIASKTPIETVAKSLGGDNTDEQARYLEVIIDNIRMINIYAPNGNPVDSEKFPYKLKWMDRLIARCRELLDRDEAFLIGGDFNIIPKDEDCHDPQTWQGDALFRRESIDKWRILQNLGLYDALRMTHPQGGNFYTFWDYQAGCWPQNKGIRIDHFLLSPRMADRLKNCTIDRAPRGWDKASDHTPIIIDI